MTKTQYLRQFRAVLGSYRDLHPQLCQLGRDLSAPAGYLLAYRDRIG